MASAKKVEKEKNIQVYLRCRPFNTTERKSGSHGVIDCDQSRKEVAVKTGGAGDKATRKTYTFDMVFGPGAKQIDVYRSVVCPILDEVIMGYNCTVFAYGQTGTGKTFTMEGERSPDGEFTWEEDPLAGIIPRTLHQIFEKLSDSGTEFSVKVSLLEIYNEELFDLLSSSPEVTERLQLFDDPRNKRGVTIKGLEEVTVHNKDEVYQILERGSAKRKTASTLMNAYSSRSHSVFSITIHMKEITLEGEELVKIGKLNLVDLAGSENIGRSGAVDRRAREAGNINQSLLTLGRVITALVEKRPHIPYRESKLTRILQDSLGGHTRTSIIATVSPASINVEESLSTLDYANRAKNIMNKPEVNQKLTKRTLIKEYTEEIERLKRDLAATRDKNGVYLSAENYENMSGQLTSQQEQITEYTDRIAAMEEELKKVTELFEDHRSQLDQRTSELEEKNQCLQETLGNLQQTRVELSEEKFICTDLASTQQQNYSTAGLLLKTVDASTADVSGLHEKLDRKNKVEERNDCVTIRFSDRMCQKFSQIQNQIQEQSSVHQANLNHYTASVGNLLAANDKTHKVAMATMATSLGGVRELVAEGVARVQAKIMAKESMCQSSRDSLQQLLDVHKQELEEVLVLQMLPGLSAVKSMNEALKNSAASYSVLASQMEAMKEQTSAFFSSHALALASLKESSMQGLASLQAEHDLLKEQLHQAAEAHCAGVQSLQEQLNLLSMKTQADYSRLGTMANAFQQPCHSLQDSLVRHCSDAESQIMAQRAQSLCATTSLVDQLQQANQEVLQTVEESSGYCSHLYSASTGLAETSLAWCSSTGDQVQRQAQDQLTLLQETTASTRVLLESVESGCAGYLRKSEAQQQQHREEVAQELAAVRERISLDRSTLEEQRKDMKAHIDACQEAVCTFVSDELQQDIPTGMTPQRREYVYPRDLAKARSRTELLESYRQQQQELQASLIQEEVQQPQDSLPEEDEDSSSSSSIITEQASDQDENLLCNQGGSFFKKKKETKSNRPKKSESEQALTPRSRLPLSSRNY